MLGLRYDSTQRKDNFWQYLNNEVQNAKTDGAGVIIQMDANCWAGQKIKKDDPKRQNKNGKVLNIFLI